MAVVDKYTDTNVEAGKKGAGLVTGTGVQTVTLCNVVSVAAADSDTSVYRVFADVPSSYIPLNICIHNTAMTAGTDYDLGLYTVNSGAVVNKEILAAALDLSSAATIATWNNSGMNALTLGTLSSLGTLSAQTDVAGAYDVALTANTIGTDAGTIRVTATFAYYG